MRGGQPTRSAEKANILCQHHNSMLSPLDETIGKIARFQADANDRQFNDSLIVKGELLERWLLKTVINSAAAGWIGPVKWQPSSSVTRAIFGLEPVPERLGLFSVDGVDPGLKPSGGTSFTPLFVPTAQGQYLAGAYVTVHGLPLLASFHVELPEMLRDSKNPELTRRFSDDGLRLLYHPGAIVMSRQEGLPVFIGVSWGGVLRYADGTTRRVD